MKSKAFNDQLERSWETNADAWTKSVREESIVSRKVATNKAVIDAIVQYEPKKVLDAGCGEGWLTRSLEGCGIPTVGFDGSEKLIHNSIEMGIGTFLHLKYEDFIEKPGLVGEGYDIVVFNFSLLSDDIRPLLTACSQILVPDGKLMIHTVHPCSNLNSERYEDGWKEETFNGMGEGYSERMPWYYRTVGSWIKEIQESGFCIVDCREPIHPETGKPLSLLLTAKIR